jgi:hypothetical protein
MGDVLTQEEIDARLYAPTTTSYVPIQTGLTAATPPLVVEEEFNVDLIME